MTITNTPYGGDKAKHLQEIQTKSSFNALDAADDSAAEVGADGTETPVISRDTIEKFGATALGLNQQAIDAALASTDDTAFTMDEFSELVGNMNIPASQDAVDALEKGTLKKGGKNDPEEVKALQQQLKDRGLYDGPIDGDYGSKTKAAVQEYQKSIGHVDKNGNADGQAGPLTRAALAHEEAAKKAIEEAKANPPEDGDATIQEVTQEDNRAVEERVTEARNDPEKMQALAKELQAKGDPRGEVLQQIVDGKLSDGVKEKCLDLMQDQESSFDELVDAVGAGDGRPEDFQALSDLARAKVGVNDDPKTKEYLTQYAQTMDAMAKASPDVRKDLMQGFKDGRSAVDSFYQSMKDASAPEDLAAVSEFAKYYETNKKLYGGGPSVNDNVTEKLDMLAKDPAAAKLMADPAVWQQVTNAITDQDWTDADFDNALRQTTDPEVKALLRKYKEAFDNR